MKTRVIHYCWFGNKEIPREAKKCIKSWEKFFPQYEIKLWNEENFDIHMCPYVEQAYKLGKYAFVSDYARFWILYKYGGIYFDTDVEVIKDFAPIIRRGPFLGLEKQNYQNEVYQKGYGVASGLGMGASANMSIYKEIIDYYDSISFDTDKMVTVVEHVTRLLQKYGFEGSGHIEEIMGITIYPVDYFCPLDYNTGELNITGNTYSIHWYNASWQTPLMHFKTKVKLLLRKIGIRL